MTGAALTGAESAELQEVLEETNVRFVILKQTDGTLVYITVPEREHLLRHNLFSHSYGFIVFISANWIFCQYATYLTDLAL